VAAKELTAKQKRFVEEYLVDLNATQAAIRAGYSAKNADKIGSQQLGNTRVSIFRPTDVITRVSCSIMRRADRPLIEGAATYLL
jgi:phage terminase small subunit